MLPGYIQGQQKVHSDDWFKPPSCSRTRCCISALRQADACRLRFAAVSRGSLFREQRLCKPSATASTAFGRILNHRSCSRSGMFSEDPAVRTGDAGLRSAALPAPRSQSEGLLKRANMLRRANELGHDPAQQSGLPGMYPTTSGRPHKQFKESASGQTSYPAAAATTTTTTAHQTDALRINPGAGDLSGDEDEEHVEQPANHECHGEGIGHEGQPEPQPAAPQVELTDTVASGIIAMSNRRAVLLEKIDMLTEAGIQGIEQLKANFKADMARMRAQVQEYTDHQEQEWRQLSNESRAAEERLRCARGLVETLNAQGLGSIQM